MTNRPNPIGQPIPEDELIERLLRYNNVFAGYGPKGVVHVKQHINPDGPAAVKEIRSLLTANTNLQQQVKMLEEENAELKSRLEVVKIKVDGKSFDLPRHTIPHRIYALARNYSGYHLAREILDGKQAEDIVDLFMPITLNEGDSFVTFPVGRFCHP